MSTRFLMRSRARQLRAVVIAACVASALALPATAFAMPIDNRPAPHTAGPGSTGDPVSPEVRTVIRTSGDTLAIIVAGAALLVAMTSAGYSAVRLATLRPARRASS
jgi:hypothetical protein